MGVCVVCILLHTILNFHEYLKMPSIYGPAFIRFGMSNQKSTWEQQQKLTYIPKQVPPFLHPLTHPSLVHSDC